jgi:prepilin-type processing-associated H-X9-DG protein
MRTDFDQPSQASSRFWSPILFADGHTRMHDFTKSLTEDPRYPFEPTKDWIWYKPADDQVTSPASRGAP